MFHLNERVLERLVTGAASASEAQRAGRHAGSCRQCARLLEEWRDNFQEIDQVYPGLNEYDSHSTEVTPAGMMIAPADNRRFAIPQIDAANALWLVALAMALLVGYGAHRLRKHDAGLDVAGSVRRPPPASAGNGAGAIVPPPADTMAVRAAPLPVDVPVRERPVAVARPVAQTEQPQRAVDLPTRDEPSRRIADQPRRAATPVRREPTSSLPRSESIAALAGLAPLPVSASFRTVSASEATSRLGGRLRMIDGLDPDHIELGPATAVPGAYRGVEVVRVVYRAPDGGRILLDQQLVPPGEAGENGATAFGTAPNGVSVGTWLDDDGYRISLVARTPVDSLRKMLPLVR